MVPPDPGRVEADALIVVRWPWGGSGCGAVFVDESGAGGSTLDRLACADRGVVSGVVGRSLVDSSVGSVGVVMLDVLFEECSELAFVPGDRPVQEFVAQCSDPAFRVCIRLRRTGRSSDRLDS